MLGLPFPPPPRHFRGPRSAQVFPGTVHLASTGFGRVETHRSSSLRHDAFVPRRVLGWVDKGPAREAAAVLALLLLAPALPCLARPAIILATTTSTQDSGLLDDLLPRFEAETGVRVKPIAVGSGEALAMGRRGDADVLLVHSKAAEEEFMAQGFGSFRADVMHNDFVLVGPRSDPAGVKGLPASDALKEIAGKEVLFVSRDDRSGTHAREIDLWKQAGVAPAGKSWYVATGQGMGETIRVASEKRAYTLADRGTFLALEKSLDLAILVEGGKELWNSYRVIIVNTGKHPKAHAKDARRFADWLVSPGAQKAIGEFGRRKLGQPLFVPDAK